MSKKIYKTEDGRGVYGVMAEFPDTPTTFHAAEKVRDAGYSAWDVYSPFPIHGIDEAMGMKASKLPLLVGVMGLLGASLGFAFQYFVRTDYAIVHQGKPADAWQVLIPVTFEFGVIFTAFSALLGMFVWNQLPMWHHPLLKKERFLRTSDDRFIIAVEATDPKFDPEATRAMLTKAGATRVELVEE
jgi:hypothetical protein